MFKSLTIFLATALLVPGTGLFAQQNPLRVFVLVGQSNMQGHAHVKTLPYLGLDPATKPMLEEIQNQNGESIKIGNVWISYLSSEGLKTGPLTTGFGADENKIGPELAFGIYMQKRLNEPVLIIKAAWGGKSIHTDFRPPSAGPYPFDDQLLNQLQKQGRDIETVKAEKREATGVYYRKTIEHIRNVLGNIGDVYPGYDPQQGYELAGLIWFQGWNDMVDAGTYPNRDQPGGYDAYSDVLCHLIRDFRRDLSVPDLPFVIGVMGVGGPTEMYPPQEQRYRKVHQHFRDAMAAPAMMKEFESSVVAVLTENYWDRELDALLLRDGEIRGRVNQAKKDEKLQDLAAKWLGNRNSLAVEAEDQGKLEKLVIEQMQSREFTAREREMMELGRSNAAYHYLGSSKILCQIGKAFAEAMPVRSRE